MKYFKTKYPEGLKSFKLSFFALIFALLTGAIIIKLGGYSPIETYKAIFTGSLGTKKGIILSLSNATPLMFTGLAFAIAYKVKMINTGAEGQLYAGAMASALVGAYIIGVPRAVHIPVALLAGIIAGGAAGIFVAYLKVKFGAGEIITTIMVNEIIILLTSYLSSGPLRTPESVISQTNMIQDTARLTKLAPRSQLTTAILIAVVIAVLLQVLLRRTALGYEMQVTGLNIKAAKTSGISIAKMYLFTFFLSGAIAGLCGSTLVLGVNARFVEGLSTKYGFGGISVAALAAYNPVAVIFSSALFGVLKAGAITLNRTTSIPIEFVDVIQTAVIVFVAAPRLIEAILSKKNKFIKSKNKTFKSAAEEKEVK